MAGRLSRAVDMSRCHDTVTDGCRWWEAPLAHLVLKGSSILSRVGERPLLLQTTTTARPYNTATHTQHACIDTARAAMKGLKKTLVNHQSTLSVASQTRFLTPSYSSAGPNRRSPPPQNQRRQRQRPRRQQLLHHRPQTQTNPSPSPSQPSQALAIYPTPAAILSHPPMAL